MFRPVVLALVAATLFGATVAVAQQPTGTASPSPTAAATVTPSPTVSPSPPPVQDLKLTVGWRLIRPDGSFLPFEERTGDVVLTWHAPAGFTGTYQVSRLESGPGSAATLAGTVPATGAAGTLSFTETIGWTFGQVCYQVRATEGPVAGPTAETCTPRPPSSGPGAAPTPAAPDSGNAGLARNP